MKNFEVPVSGERPEMAGENDRAKHDDAASDDPKHDQAAYDASPVSGLSKLHLATPVGHGSTLQSPRLSEIGSLWQENIAIDDGGVAIGEFEVSKLKRSTRREILGLAESYSNRYGDFAPPRDTDLIVMAGHQPGLFHPGVWYKNFVLSRLGQQFGATAINMVVDNDVCANAAVQVPQSVNSSNKGVGIRPDENSATGEIGSLVHSKQVRFDAPGYNVPYEERSVIDAGTFASFGDRAANEIAAFVGDPIVSRLWPHVLESTKPVSGSNQPNLGAALAAGRHRLESEIGLRTLEIPLSQIADTNGFRVFTQHVCQHLALFREIYNSSLQDYRRLYHIRSNSHPVPDLAEEDGWIEAPFWVWNVDDPFRKRLFVKTGISGSTIELSNRESWSVTVPTNRIAESIGKFSDDGIRIRPRALMTTMFCRLLLSDLFVHGIGGAKYDQLTDLIAQRFFGIRLPEFCAMSATMKLPTGYTSATQDDITETKQQLRQLEFHAENFIETSSRMKAQPETHQPKSQLSTARQPTARQPTAQQPTAQQPAAQQPTAQQPAARQPTAQLPAARQPTAQLPAAQKWVDLKRAQIKLPSSKQRHNAIVECNQNLQSLVSDQRATLSAELEDLRDQVRKNEVLGSREFSFCLFPESLIEALSRSF